MRKWNKCYGDLLIMASPLFFSRFSGFGGIIKETVCKKFDIKRN